VGGRNWAGRVLQAAHSGALGDLGHPGMRPERLGMFRSHDDRHGARLGRGPAGVIDTQTFRTKVRENLQLKRDIEEYQQRQGGKFTPLRQVTTGDEVRPDPAKDEWFKVNAMGFGGATGDYIEYADLSGRQHRITGDKMVMVRKPPEFEPYKAATAQQQADLDRWQADAAKAPPFRIVRPTRGMPKKTTSRPRRSGPRWCRRLASASPPDTTGTLPTRSAPAVNMSTTRCATTCTFCRPSITGNWPPTLPCSRATTSPAT
jgi:hypothetical protein